MSEMIMLHSLPMLLLQVEVAAIERNKFKVKNANKVYFYSSCSVFGRLGFRNSFTQLKENSDLDFFGHSSLLIFTVSPIDRDLLYLTDVMLIISNKH